MRPSSLSSGPPELSDLERVDLSLAPRASAGDQGPATLGPAGELAGGTGWSGPGPGWAEMDEMRTALDSAHRSLEAERAAVRTLEAELLASDLAAEGSGSEWTLLAGEHFFEELLEALRATARYVFVKANQLHHGEVVGLLSDLARAGRQVYVLLDEKVATGRQV